MKTAEVRDGRCFLFGIKLRNQEKEVFSAIQEIIKSEIDIAEAAKQEKWSQVESISKRRCQIIENLLNQNRSLFDSAD